MFCKQCGKEIADNSLFCTFCGAEQCADSVATENGAISIFHSLFSSNNFHLLTLFYLVSVCATAIANLAAGVVRLPILEAFVIFAFFKLQKLAKENQPLEAFASPLKTLRIIVDINRVFAWIMVAIFIICGVVMIVADGTFYSIFADLIGDLGSEEASLAFSSIGTAVIAVCGAIFIFGGVIGALLTIFMYGSFRKTAKSAELSAKTGDIYISSVSATRKWLVVFMVLNAISFASNSTPSTIGIFSFIATCFNLVFLFLLFKLLGNIKNYRQNGIL